ncbi:MAG: hypothetical protein AAF378_19425 [Cyanobacteria bacterium P01_A01_bin.84]
MSYQWKSQKVKNKSSQIVKPAKTPLSKALIMPLLNDNDLDLIRDQGLVRDIDFD